jgi:hypothetical protein
MEERSMGSNQNPIHRDRDKRGKGAQPYQDAKEAMNQNEAKIERTAPFGENENDGLTDAQRDDLRRQAASERLARVQSEMENDEPGKGGTDGH